MRRSAMARRRSGLKGCSTRPDSRPAIRRHCGAIDNQIAAIASIIAPVNTNVPTTAAMLASLRTHHH
jgi:hypothetical protein